MVARVLLGIMMMQLHRATSFVAPRALCVCRGCGVELSRANLSTSRSLRSAASMQAAGSTALDTVFALSSGPVGQAGVAVIRISGPEAKSALEALMSGAPQGKCAASNLHHDTLLPSMH
jgi:hypothetical protein